MTWYIWIAAVLLALFALYLWMIAPRRAGVDTSALTGKLYAHRGLHDGNQQVFENSMEAFRRAVEAGYGIELDVQRTLDDMLVVHHDGNTARVCGRAAEIRNTRYEELPPLPDGSPVPLFADVLGLVNGRVPLFVEVKEYGSPVGNAAAALAQLKDYRGPFCVESFHPMAIRYFRKTAPGILRGQHAPGGRRSPAEISRSVFYPLKYLLINVLSRPHFVAYQCNSDRNLSIWLMKHLYRPLLAAWTIRSQPELDRASRFYQMPIFERFTPDEAALPNRADSKR